MAAIGGKIAEVAGGLATTAVLAATVAELSQPQRSTHWSFYVLVGASCVAAIVAVAAAVLANYPLTATSALFWITNTVGALFIKRFSFYKDFDQTVDKLDAQTKKVIRETKKLERSNERLQQEIEPLRKVETALKEQLIRRRTLLAQQQQATGELAHAVGALNHGAAGLLPAQLKAGQALEEELARLIQERDTLEVQVSSLKQSTATVQRVDDNLDEDRADLRRQIEKLTAQIDELQTALLEAQAKREQAGADVAVTTHELGGRADAAAHELDSATDQDVATIRNAEAQVAQASQMLQVANDTFDAFAALADFMRQTNPRPPSRGPVVDRDSHSPPPGDIPFSPRGARSFSPAPPEALRRQPGPFAAQSASPLPGSSGPALFHTFHITAQPAQSEGAFALRPRRNLATPAPQQLPASLASSDTEEADAAASEDLSSLSSSRSTSTDGIAVARA